MPVHFLSRCILLFNLCWPALSAHADGWLVGAVAPPAWIDRSGSLPATPGMALLPGDRLRTGTGGRLHLQRGPLLHAQLAAESQLQLTRDQLVLDRGTLRVISDSAADNLGLGAGALQLDGRGFDLWLQHAAHPAVFLARGRVNLLHQRRLLTLFEAGPNHYRSDEATPVAQPVEARAGLPLLTDLPPGSQQGGPWQVIIASEPAQPTARAVQTRLQADGFAAELRPAQVRGRATWRAGLGGFADRGTAQAFARRIGTTYNPSPAWVLAP